MQKIRSVFPEKDEFFCNYAPLGIMLNRKKPLNLSTEPLSLRGTEKTTEDNISCVNGMVLGRPL